MSNVHNPHTYNVLHIIYSSLTWWQDVFVLIPMRRDYRIKKINIFLQNTIFILHYSNGFYIFNLMFKYLDHNQEKI